MTAWSRQLSGEPVAGGGSDEVAGGSFGVGSGLLSLLPGGVVGGGPVLVGGSG